jgi:hypothetical protein
MMTTGTQVAVAFAGWFRPAGGCWQKVCVARGYDACYGELLDRTRSWPSGAAVVLRQGERPDRHPDRRPQGR